MKRITWTKNEALKVKERLFCLMVGDYKKGKIILESQDVLPKDRRRKTNSYSFEMFTNLLDSILNDTTTKIEMSTIHLVDKITYVNKEMPSNEVEKLQKVFDVEIKKFLPTSSKYWIEKFNITRSSTMNDIGHIIKNEILMHMADRNVTNDVLNTHCEEIRGVIVVIRNKILQDLYNDTAANQSQIRLVPPPFNPSSFLYGGIDRFAPIKDELKLNRSTLFKYPSPMRPTAMQLNSENWFNYSVMEEVSLIKPVTETEDGKVKEVHKTDFDLSLIEISKQIDALLEKKVQLQLEEYRLSVDKLIADKVQQKLASTFEFSSEEISRKVDEQYNAALSTTTNNGKPRVVVVGLKGSQIGIVKETVKDDLRIQFIDADHNVRQLRHTCKSADYVLMMTGFISHKHTDVINNQTHKGCILVAGGMTELVDKLATLA